ncbi:MAG: hypothetical protein IT426_12780 [Pirellulales bacterium]|nr:hypothetical protein [Pirellulales bacterium]
MEPTPFPEKRRTFRTPGLVLGLLVIVHAGLGICFNPVRTNLPAYVTYLLAGFFFSQPFLFAFWAAFAPHRFSHRFVWTLLLCFLFSSNLEYGASYYGEGHEWFDPDGMYIANFDEQIREMYSAVYPGPGFFMLVFSFSFLSATMVLSLMRWKFGWQLSHPTDEITDGDYRRYQFGIKHLIIITTVFAIFCAFLRTLSLICPRDTIPPFAVCAETIFQVVGVLSLPVVVAFFVLTVSKKTWASTFVAQFKIGVVLFVIICLYLIFRDLCCKFFTPRIFARLRDAFFCWTYSDWTWSISRVVEIMLFFQFGAVISTLLTSLVMRLSGFRLVRVKKASA